MGETERDRGERLCDAAKAGDAAAIKSLVDDSYDVTYLDADGLTPLMHAAKHGHTEVVRKLLEAGAPWNALSPSNFSAGDFAMENGHQEAFDVLLNAGTLLILFLVARLLDFSTQSSFFLCGYA